jgi:DNA-binding transcriptional ArsR family regulator
MATSPIPIHFAVTPRFDVFYALYTAMSDAASPLDEWRRRAVERLPVGFEQRARKIAPLPIFWPLLADSVQKIPGEMMFDDMLQALGAMPVAELRSHILSGIFHDPAVTRSLVSGKKNLRQVVNATSLEATDLLTHFGLRPYDPRSQSAKTILALVGRPELFRDDLVVLLRQFWESGFGGDWAELEPALNAESIRMSHLREEFSVARLVGELGLPVAFDDASQVIRPRHGPPIAYDRVEQCYVIPSAFNIRRWWAKYELKAGRFTLYFPVLTKAAALNRLHRTTSKPNQNNLQPHIAINAERVFRALGDTTRYAIASILARTPTSSAELARTLDVSKPTITHHVQTLRSAGLITDTPSGGSTKLSLNRKTVGAVSGAALEQLFSSSTDLRLTTTRKRQVRLDD